MIRCFMQSLIRGRSPADMLGMIIPAYFNLATDEGWQKWETLVAYGDSGVRIKVVLAEPEFQERHLHYVNAIKLAHQHKVAVLGGLSLTRGQKAIEKVKKELSLWHQGYGVLPDGDSLDGFYFVDQPTDKNKDDVDYVATVFAHARSLRANYQIVSCPGGLCDEDYLTKARADVLCISVGPGEPKPADWMAAHEPWHFAAINYGLQTEDAMKDRVTHMVANHISWVYVADTQGVPNQLFQFIPAFMESEVAFITNLNVTISRTSTDQIQKKARPRK